MKKSKIFLFVNRVRKKNHEKGLNGFLKLSIDEIILADGKHQPAFLFPMLQRYELNLVQQKSTA